MSDTTQHRRRPLTDDEKAEVAARLRAAQRKSWDQDPLWRRRRAAIGSVHKAAIVFHDDDTFDAEVKAALALGRAQGAAAARSEAS